MKTSILLPDPLFEAAEQLARQLGKSRSQLYAEALREYRERRRDEDVTRRPNEIQDAEPELAELDPVLDALQLEMLRKEKWQVNRGEIWWARLPEPFGSEPEFHRPVVIIQSDRFNRSRITAVIAAAITRNLRLRTGPGSVYLPRRTGGLDHDSVVNVSQLVTLERRRLDRLMGRLWLAKLHKLEDGLRLVLAL